MTTVSSLLSVVVLVAALLSVIAFAFTAQNIRYIYLQQLETKIARTQEAVSAGAWYTDTIVVIEVKNIGAKSVFIKTVKVTIGYVIVYENDGQTTRSYNKVFTNIYLPPLHRKIFTFDILDDISLPVGAEKTYINYVAIIVATDKNVYIFDPAPPTDSIILEIDRNSIGKTVTIQLPSGETAKFTVYEYLLCSIGSLTRFTSSVSKLEAAKVIVAIDPNTTVEGFYNYGYDYDTGKFPSVSIKVFTKSYNLTGEDDTVSITECTISSPDIVLGGKAITISRGLILLGTPLSRYDVVSFSFARNPYPRYYTPSELGLPETSSVYITNGKSNAFIFKIPLADKDITVLDYLGPQITPWIVAEVQDKSSVINIGNYYSQAILVGQSYTAIVVGRGQEITVHVGFSDPYPILLVITQPYLKENS